MHEKLRERLNFFGITVFVAFCVAQLSAGWEWSIMIDDVGFNQWMPQLVATKGYFGALLQETRSYIVEGRFFPVKYVFNLLKWGYLPKIPSLFFWVDFAVVALSIGMASLALAGKERAWVFFLVGLGFLQRQVMEAAALNSVADGWVILFFAAGLWAFPRPILYRVLFIFCALAKEPAVFVFLATTIVYTYQLVVNKLNRSQWLKNILIDLVLFLILVSIVIAVKYFWADPNKNYTGDYRYLSLGTLKLLIQAVVRSTIGMAVFLGFFGYFYQRDGKSWRELFRDPELLLLGLLTGIFFIVTAAPRGATGYVLVPPSFAFYVATGALLIRMLPQINWTKGRATATAVFLSLMLIYSLLRYTAFVRATNETIAAVNHLTFANTPRLVLMNSNEGAAKSHYLAEKAGTPVQYYYYSSLDDALSVVSKFKGEVFFLEFSYFEKYSPDVIEKLGQAVGGWKSNFKRDHYRFFYGVKQ